MTDAQITRKYPDLSAELAQVAVLGVTLNMAKDMELALCNLEAEGGEELVQSLGSPSEIIEAQATASKTIAAILNQVSEQDLQAGLDLDLLSAEDHRAFVKTIRMMALERAQSRTPGHDLER
ncbi:MAG: hypothetical protein JKY92_05995 [Magnetovibrio sp.]|nr:hypothetical protein [Magnetovibrio sp.]